MRRRDFLAALGGAAAPVFGPRPGRAQQRLPVVGYLMSRSASDASHLTATFKEGLRAAGFTDGENVKIEYRWADGDFAKLPPMAGELTRMPVSVLTAVGGEPSVTAAKAATSTIPIVFAMSGDPVKLGLAQSFNRPGKNATGVHVLTATMEPKRLGLLHELVPHARTIAAFVNSTFVPSKDQVTDLEEAAKQSGTSLRIFRIGGDPDFEPAFATINRERIGGLAVAGSPFFDTRRNGIAELAARYRVPAIYHFREYAVAGGLMSYSVDIRAVYRQVGLYTGQILKGAKPADLPIVVPSKFELVINLKSAKALGLTIPPTLLARADEVLE